MSATSDLIAWAQALGKDVRTVRRYANRGIIPGAVCVSGRWEVPFSAEAFITVQERLIGWARKRLTTSEWPSQREKIARLYTAAYALWLGLRCEPLKEAALADFYQRVIFSQDEPLPRECAVVDETARDQWDKCLSFAKDWNLRRTALCAAFAHAAIELHAMTKTEACAEVPKNRFRPFKLPVGGEVKIRGKRRSRGSSNHAEKDDVRNNRLRKQVIEHAKRAISVQTVIKKWQWILGKRTVKSSGVVHRMGKTGSDFVTTRSRYYSRRTFYVWYSADDLREAEKMVC